MNVLKTGGTWDTKVDGTQAYVQKLAFQQDHRPFGTDRRYSSMSLASYINRGPADYGPGGELACT